jgi:hypothetical protein
VNSSLVLPLAPLATWKKFGPVLGAARTNWIDKGVINTGA